MRPVVRLIPWRIKPWGQISRDPSARKLVGPPEERNHLLLMGIRPQFLGRQCSPGALSIEISRLLQHLAHGFENIFDVTELSVVFLRSNSIHAQFWEVGSETTFGKYPLTRRDSSWNGDCTGRFLPYSGCESVVEIFRVLLSRYSLVGSRRLVPSCFENEI
jgi:hypothetical protein